MEVSKQAGLIEVEEKNEGLTQNDEKNEGITQIAEKNKGITQNDEKNKGPTQNDEKNKGQNYQIYNGAPATQIEPERAGNDRLYPMMLESPQFRWTFIRKVYVIISMQLLLTAGVAATVVFFKPISHFFRETPGGIAAYIGIVISTFILLCPMYAYRKHHPWNFLLLFLFTIAIAFTVGIACSFTKGEIILEGAILTCVVVVSLTLYTFWAVRRGQDFSFLGPFLFAALMLLIAFSLIQIFFPLGRIAMMMISLFSALIFSAYIVYDTDNLIKRFSYDDYIWAAVSLYLDIINLFLSLLGVGRAVDS